jgi:hypothetical protein
MSADAPPRSPWRVTSVEVLPELRLRVTFVDGLSGFVDLSNLVQSTRAGVFAALADPALFAQVWLEYGAVTWPGGLDLAPDAMHTAIQESGEWRL